MDDRDQILELVAPEPGRELGFARRHPVSVADERVDFPIVRDQAERLCEGPGRKRIRGKPLMEERNSRHRPLVLEIGKEAGEVRRDHETLIDHSPR